MTCSIVPIHAAAGALISRTTKPWSSSEASPPGQARRREGMDSAAQAIHGPGEMMRRAGRIKWRLTDGNV
jgi:hypothetical protein